MVLAVPESLLKVRVREAVSERKTVSLQLLESVSSETDFCGDADRLVDAEKAIERDLLVEPVFIPERELERLPLLEKEYPGNDELALELGETLREAVACFVREPRNLLWVSVSVAV